MYKLNSLRSGRTLFSPVRQQNLLLSNATILAHWDASFSGRIRGYFNGERDSRDLKLMAHLHIVLSKKMRRCVPLLHSNQQRYLLYFRNEKLWL
jgi:hypothetical protein